MLPDFGGFGLPGLCEPGGQYWLAGALPLLRPFPGTPPLAASTPDVQPTTNTNTTTTLAIRDFTLFPLC